MLQGFAIPDAQELEAKLTAAAQQPRRAPGAAEALRAWRARRQVWQDVPAGSDPFALQRRACGCGPQDRVCLQCGRRACAACQPESGGGACTRCGGPVWADGEARCPPTSNPQMKGY